MTDRYPPLESEYAEIARRLREAEAGIERLQVAVRKCRAAQKAYFKDRTQENLIAAKQAETALDKLLDARPALIA